MVLAAVTVGVVLAAAPPAPQLFPAIPGVEYVGRGVDHTTMDMGLAQVTQNEWAVWYTWQNPFTDQTYQVPEMMFVETVTQSQQSNYTQVFSDATSYQMWSVQHQSWSSGLFGMTSNTETTFHYFGKYYNEGQSLAETYLDIMYYKLWAPVPIPQLDPGFVALVNALPSDISSAANYAKYERFFQSVGTSMMSEAYFGGQLTTRTWYAQCLVDVQSQHWVKTQSHWSFCGLIGDNAGSVNAHTKVTKDFAECSSTDVKYRGGKSSSFSSPLKWFDWAKTIAADPIPVSYQLTPYFTILADSMDAGLRAKASVMEAATIQYGKNAQARMNQTGEYMKKNAPSLPKPPCCSSLEAQQDERAAKEIDL